MSQTSEEEQNSSMQIVRNHIDDEDKYRFGYTQIFFRAGQVARLEEIRTNIRKRYIITIQSLVRRFITRRKYVRMREAIMELQRYARGYLVRKRMEADRKQRAAIIIQKYFRGWLWRHRFHCIMRSVLLLQAYGRGIITRRQFKEAVMHHRIVKIQRLCRGFLARKVYALKKRKIIVCQSAIRRFLARRQFKRLKAEARSISHVQKMYKGLENKIILMQQKIDEMNKENAELKDANANIPMYKRQLQEKKTLEIENRALKEQFDNVEVKINQIRIDIDRERDEKMSLLEEKNVLEETLKAKISEMNTDNEKLHAELKESKAAISRYEEENEKCKRLVSDTENNELHQAYQRAVKDKEFLESENFVLKEEIDRLIKRVPLLSPVTHSRSISNVSSLNLEEDFGYSSARNTLELKKSNSKHDESNSPKLGSEFIQIPNYIYVYLFLCT